MNMAPFFSACVFDLDGTLIDSIHGIDAAARAALAVLAPGETLPSLRPFIGPPIRVMLARALKWNDPCRLDNLEKIFRDYYDGGFWADSPCYPGVNETLNALSDRGCRLYLLTNKPVKPTSQIIDYLGWAKIFDTIVCPQSRIPPFADKTSAAIHLRDRHGLEPTKTLLVGDSADDHEAAHSAGFVFAAAAWGYGGAARRSNTHVLNSFSDVLNLTPSQSDA